MEKKCELNFKRTKPTCLDVCLTNIRKLHNANAERIDYARRLERIESLKAKKNSLANLKQNNDSQISDSRGRTDDFVAQKFDIGSRDTYRKEKYIVDNQHSLSPEDFGWTVNKKRA